MIYARVPKWSTGIGSGPIGVGLRGFESLPLHLKLIFDVRFVKYNSLTVFIDKEWDNKYLITLF